jgi:hypothetical protein
MRDRVSASVVSEYRSRPLPFQTPQDVLSSATVIQTANVQNDRISLACQPFQSVMQGMCESKRSTKPNNHSGLNRFDFRASALRSRLGALCPNLKSACSVQPTCALAGPYAKTIGRDQNGESWRSNLPALGC